MGSSSGQLRSETLSPRPVHGGKRAEVLFDSELLKPTGGPPPPLQVRTRIRPWDPGGDRVDREELDRGLCSLICKPRPRPFMRKGRVSRSLEILPAPQVLEDGAEIVDQMSPCRTGTACPGPPRSRRRKKQVGVGIQRMVPPTVRSILCCRLIEDGLASADFTHIVPMEDAFLTPEMSTRLVLMST